MWEYFTLKRAGARKILEDASREKQEGIQGQWQQESPFREILEHVIRNADMGYFPNDAEEEKSSEWTLERTREA